jgi:hypothetical protein
MKLILWSILLKLFQNKKMSRIDNQRKAFISFYPKNGVAATMKKFNLTKTQVSNRARRLGLRVNYDVLIMNRSNALSKVTTSTTEIDNDLQKHYLKIPSKALAKKVGKSDTFVRTRLRQLGLVIPREIIEKRKSESQIKKGSIPPNKGKKMPAHIYEKAKPTMFKKGNLPMNTLHDNAITVRKDKSGNFYLHIRISKGKWQMLHVYNWEKINGTVPEGKILVFKNRTRMDCQVSNLECITLEENMRRNSINNYPKEVIEVIKLKSKLQTKLKNLNHG